MQQKTVADIQELPNVSVNSSVGQVGERQSTRCWCLPALNYGEMITTLLQFFGRSFVAYKSHQRAERETDRTAKQLLRLEFIIKSMQEELLLHIE